MVKRVCAGTAAAAMMILVTAAGTIFCAENALAQDNKETSVKGQTQFSADFPSQGHVRLMLCSSGVDVTGTNEEKIEVRLKAEYSADISHVSVSFKKKGDTGTLRISGCPHNNFEIALRIPQDSDLYARMFAGDLDIRGVNGNKDVELHVGDMNLGVGDASRYGNVDVSVTIGDLDAGAFSVSKDGFFRSWHRHASGKYGLYAHVGVGDLTLQ